MQNKIDKKNFFLEKNINNILLNFIERERERERERGCKLVCRRVKLNKPLTLWTASASNPTMNMVMTDAV